MSAEQRAYWNGPAGERWATGQARMDESLEPATRELIPFAAPRPGERALDVGCGCGTTTLRLRDLGCAVTGIDVSGPMLEVARARAPELSFVLADAATHAFRAEHDLVFSRFGVMFFEDPVAAFANLRTSLAPGGRLAFACWRALADNPWAAAPLAATRDLLPPPEPVEPHAPGPFAFADRDRLIGILERARFTDITVTPRDTAMFMGATIEQAADEGLSIGPLARLASGLDPDARAAIRDRLVAEYARHVTPAGIALGAAIWLVAARR